MFPFTLCLLSHSVLSDSGPPMDCSPQAPLSMRILQARILKWVTMPFSRGSSQPRNRTQVSCIAGSFFTVWATREACSLWPLKRPQFEFFITLILSPISYFSSRSFSFLTSLQRSITIVSTESKCFCSWEIRWWYKWRVLKANVTVTIGIRPPDGVIRTQCDSYNASLIPHNKHNSLWEYLNAN